VLALGAGLPAGLTTDETPVAGTSDQGAIEPPLGAVSPRPRLVEFYGPDCPVCQRVAPAVRTLQQDCTGQRIEVLTVDVGQPENRELVQRLGIRAIPTFVALDAAGEERVRFVGERGLDDLRSVAALLIDRSCAGVDGSRAGVATGVDGAGCPEGAETAAAEDAFTAAAPVCGG